MSTDAPVVLVTGATGTVGSRVVNRLLSAGVPVRAAGRSADSVRARFGDRVEATGLDFTDPLTWDRTLGGVRTMFLVRPPQLGRPKTQLLPALEYARRAGLRRVVFLSLQGAERNPVVPHATIEAWLVAADGIDHTFVRPSFFMQNLSTTHRRDLAEHDEIVVPAGRGATAFVDAEDVAAVAAEALLHPDEHRNRAWTPTGPEALTYAEVAAILSEVLGRPIRYPRPGLLRYARHARRELGMPLGMVAVTSAIYSVARFGRAAGQSDDVRRVTGRAPIPFRDFAVREAAAWARPRGADQAQPG